MNGQCTPRSRTQGTGPTRYVCTTSSTGAMTLKMGLITGLAKPGRSEAGLYCSISGGAIQPAPSLSRNRCLRRSGFQTNFGRILSPTGDACPGDGPPTGLAPVGQPIAVWCKARWTQRNPAGPAIRAPAEGLYRPLRSGGADPPRLPGQGTSGTGTLSRRPCPTTCLPSLNRLSPGLGSHRRPAGKGLRHRRPD